MNYLLIFESQPSGAITKAFFKTRRELNDAIFKLKENRSDVHFVFTGKIVEEYEYSKFKPV